MAKSIETIINRFDGGISDDVREKASNKFAISRHFNIFDNPYRLTPYRTTEADTHDGSTATGMKQYDVRDFVFVGSNSRLYGMGKNGSGQTKIVYKADPTDGNWTLPASSETSAAVKYGCFLEFNGRLLGFTGNNVFVYNIGTPGFTNTATAATVSTIAQGVIAKDKNAYLAYNNKIVRVNESYTVSEPLTLPADLKVTSLENYGNYLSIACANKDQSGSGRSYVFLWDLTSDDVAESLDWGEGEIRVLGNIEGRLVGISNALLNTSLGSGYAKLVLREWATGIPQVSKQLISKTTTKSPLQYKAIKNNRVYFSAALYIQDSSTLEEGIWVYGRRDINSPFSLTLDTIEPAADADGVTSFGNAGNFWFINHSADGSITKTDDSATFTTTSSYESQKFYCGDLTRDKELLRVALSYVPLTSGQQVVLKYRKDQETSYTPLFTRTTANEVGHVVKPNIGRYKEVQFRIESTGGAEITELRFIENLLDD